MYTQSLYTNGSTDAMQSSRVAPSSYTIHDLLHSMCNKIFWCEEDEWGKLTVAPIDHPAISEFPLPAYT